MTTINTGTITQARVAWLDGGGYVVAGTVDLDLAQAMVARYVIEEFDHTGEDAWELMPPIAYVGWMRWNPCHPNSCRDGGDHRGHLAFRPGPGRGSFLGVYLDPDNRYHDQDGIDPKAAS